jgi:hypothetical protein
VGEKGLLARQLTEKKRGDSIAPPFFLTGLRKLGFCERTGYMVDMEGTQNTQGIQNIKDAEILKKGGFNRKTLLAGFVIALLFIGGGIYAWQGSQLKGAIGGAVQTVGLDTVPQKETQDQDALLIAEEVQKEVDDPDPVVRRTAKEVVRAQSPGRVIAVAVPNGGEVFCLGETIDVVWQYQGVQEVRVFLQSDYITYNLGVMPASGENIQQTISASREGLYKVFVQDAQAWEVQDKSNALFAIKDCKE